MENYDVSATLDTVGKLNTNLSESWLLLLSLLHNNKSVEFCCQTPIIIWACFGDSEDSVASLSIDTE